MYRFFVSFVLEFVVLASSISSSPSPREIFLTLGKPSNDAKGPKSAKMADSTWPKYERKAAENWALKGKERPKEVPISLSAVVDFKDQEIISRMEDSGKKPKHGGHRGLGRLGPRGEEMKSDTEFSKEDSKKTARFFWTESNSMAENKNLRERREEDLHPASGDTLKGRSLNREGRGVVQLELRRRRSLRKTRGEGLRSNSRRRWKRRRRRNRSKGRIWRQKRLTDEDVMNDDEDDLDSYFDGFNKRRDRAAAKPVAVRPELMIPPHDVIPLDGPTRSQPPEFDQNPTASPASSDGDTANEELKSPYGNMNLSFVPNDVSDFASKLQNPAVVRNFYHEYSLLANFPRETISWDEPDLAYDCWVQAMLVGRFPYAPSCETDGTYTRKQCYLQRCWCVQPDGQPVVKDRGERFYYKMAAVNLKCLPPTKRPTPQGGAKATTTPVGQFDTFFNLSQTNKMAEAANQTAINSTDNDYSKSADNQTLPIASTDNQSETTAADADNPSRTIEPRPITEAAASMDNQYNITNANTDNLTEPKPKDDNQPSPSEPNLITDNPLSPVKLNPGYDNPLQPNSSAGNHSETIAFTDNQSDSKVANTDNSTASNPGYDNPPSLVKTQPINDNLPVPIKPNPIIDNPPLQIEPNPIIDNPPLQPESLGHV